MERCAPPLVSLTISILLFISATGIVGVFQYLAGNAANTNNFDLQAFNMNQEQIDDLRAQDSVDRTALYGYESFWAVIPKEDQAEDYWEVYELQSSTRGDTSQSVKELRVYYLEDTVLREYLVEQGIDPEPYFDEECPMALVYQPNTTTYREDPETGEWTRYTYKTGLVAEGVETLTVYPEQCPDEVHIYISDLISDYSYQMSPAEYMPVYAFAPMQELDGSGVISAPAYSDNAVRVAVIAEENEAGQTVYAYYLYEAENDKLDDTHICTVEQSEDIPQFMLGDMIEESPFGLNASCRSDVETVTLILPLSAAEDIEKDDLRLSVSINDYDAITAYLTENEIIYDDYLASERQARDIILMVNVFSYGFIILITMISVANVFNTITTNIALRRRDFGMLRSVGMKTGELYRMMGFECLNYGGSALIWGLPMGLVIDFGIHLITINATNETYAPPWGVIAVVVISVFLIVFTTTFYAVSKLRKDNPIDAIKMENI